MSEFALDLSRFRIETEKQLSQVVRKVAFELFTLVVTRSPVDTGRFRANNQIAMNNLPGGSTLEIDKTGQTTLRKGNAILATFKLGDTIFIYNNVEYALTLEYGHSKQAPQGTYRLAMQDVVNHFDQLART